MSTASSATAQQQQQHLPPLPPSTSPSATRSAMPIPSASGSSSSRQNQQPQQPLQSPPTLQNTLPSAEQQRYVSEARAAVVASMENMMDSELQWRATTLHGNAAQLKKQATDVQRATDGLRREADKLAREADVAARRVKELGNVQNWAEVLERDFLVLEETVRLANGDVGSRGSSCTCSCSECGLDEEDRMSIVDEEEEREEGDDKGKGKGKEVVGKDVVMEEPPQAWSEASRSLTEPASSTGTGRAKSNDTASVSTTG